MPDYTFTLTDAENDAVAASVGPAEVENYLAGQVATVVAQHVDRAKREALKADGFSEKLADAGLDADELDAVRAIRTDKRAAAEAAKVAAEAPIE